MRQAEVRVRPEDVTEGGAAEVAVRSGVMGSASAEPIEHDEERAARHVGLPVAKRMRRLVSA